MPDEKETKREARKKETIEGVKKGPVIRCFKFKGKRVCRDIRKKERPTKVIKVQIPEFGPPPIPRFETPALRPKKVRTGEREAYVTRETLKKLKKKKIGVKRIRG